MRPARKIVYEMSSEEPQKPKKDKERVKIEYVNQDLKQAIQEVKLNVNQKKKQSLQKETNKINPERKEESQNSKLFFTETFKKKYETRLQEVEEKRKQIVAKSLSKQMKARLLRKIKQNSQLQDKMDLLKDIQERREHLITERKLKEKKKLEEKKMLHESSLDKVKMMRSSKKRQNKSSLKESRSIRHQSQKQLQFQRYIRNKEMQNQHMLLKSRQQFLKKSRSTDRFLHSQRSHRSRKISLTHNSYQRNTQTSQAPRQFKQRQTSEEDLLREQSIKDQTSSRVDSQGVQQRKYNKGVRGFENRTNQQNIEELEKSRSEQKIEDEVAMESNPSNLFQNKKIKETNV